MNRGLPIQLFHPSFARFMRRAHDNTVKMDLGPEIYSATHSLTHAAAEIYPDEARRAQAVEVFLDKAIGHSIPALDIPGMRTDGAYRVSCGSVYVLAAVKEDKNEIGMGGCDPSLQCTMGFRSYCAGEEASTFLPPSSVFLSYMCCR
jgi:hypothetical protein